MNSSVTTPKLPSWIFYITDLALIGVAVLIAYSQGWKPAGGWLAAIIICVGTGVLAGLLPLVAKYEAEKNEALDERQRALEALSRTVSSSAEQISIAATGLHEIGELAQKNLRQAEQLPQKLQEKVAEFQAQLAQAADADREELERELLALRSSESERLDTVSQRIAKSSAEWTKLEAATQQHLTAASDALAKLALGTADAIGKAQVAAEQALAQARVEAARQLGETAAQASGRVETAQAAALAALDAKLAATIEQAAEKLTALFDARLESVAAQLLQSRADTTNALATSSEAARATIASAQATALAALEAKLNEAADRFFAALDNRLSESARAGLTQTTSTPSAASSPVLPSPVVDAPATGPVENTSAAETTPESDASFASAVVPTSAPEAPAAPPPKRSRRARREEPTPGSTPVPSVTPAGDTPAAESTPESLPADTPSIEAADPVDTSLTSSLAVSPTADSVRGEGERAAENAATGAAEIVALPEAMPERAAATEPPASLPSPAPIAAEPGAVESAPTDSMPELSAASLASEVPPAETPPSIETAAPANGQRLDSPPGVVTSLDTADSDSEHNAELARPNRRRTRQPEPVADAEPDLGLELDESSPRRAGVTDRVLTSDGATRLLVTAYIGIGNRLFIRGDGPGLSWDKGVPLQFVSIGKWRWESNDATGPIQFKLYKNDDLECAALGAQQLDPGHQQEVTAAF
jgi:hypothetical protein